MSPPHELSIESVLPRLTVPNLAPRQIFRFETVDLYDGKNIPKVIYCIHALSHLLARRGLTGEMNDLVGQIDFTGTLRIFSRSHLQHFRC